MGSKALVVSAVVNCAYRGNDSGCVLAGVASVVDYGAAGGGDFVVVAVVFGDCAGAVCGDVKSGGDERGLSVMALLLFGLVYLFWG